MYFVSVFHNDDDHHHHHHDHFLSIQTKLWFIYIWRFFHRRTKSRGDLVLRLHSNDSRSKNLFCIKPHETYTVHVFFSFPLVNLWGNLFTNDKMTWKMYSHGIEQKMLNARYKKKEEFWKLNVESWITPHIFI